MGSLRDEISDDVTEMFTSDLDDIPVPCTYVSFDGNPNYDPANKAVSHATNVTRELLVVVDSFSFSRSSAMTNYTDDHTVLSIDLVFIFPSSQMTGLIPKVKDYVINTLTNAKYDVVGLIDDPAGAHYELHVRPIEVA